MLALHRVQSWQVLTDQIVKESCCQSEYTKQLYQYLLQWVTVATNPCALDHCMTRYLLIAVTIMVFLLIFYWSPEGPVQYYSGVKLCTKDHGRLPYTSCDVCVYGLGIYVFVCI